MHITKISQGCLAQMKEIGMVVNSCAMYILKLNFTASYQCFDPHKMNLDPDPEFWPNLDPDPGLCYLF